MQLDSSLRYGFSFKRISREHIYNTGTMILPINVFLNESATVKVPKIAHTKSKNDNEKTLL